MKRFLIVFSLVVFSCGVFANQNTGPVEITAVQNWNGTDGLYIWTDQNSKTNPSNCSYTGNYVTAGSISDVFRTMIMSAFVANKKVDLTIYNGNCSNNRPVVVAVKIIR